NSAAHGDHFRRVQIRARYGALQAFLESLPQRAARTDQSAGERHGAGGALVAEEGARERAHVEHELLAGEREQCLRARIAGVGGGGGGGGSRAGGGGGGRGGGGARAPREGLSAPVAPARGGHRAEKFRRRPAAAAARGSPREGARADPTAAPFVTAIRSPSAA